ncbi:hypothetical protein [Natronorarus salvus]|uniref:hypothetical protein n=1 Tax=Natronorarus salvus TaxID=3117733 RepID=UPI002F26BEEA
MSPEALLLALSLSALYVAHRMFASADDRLYDEIERARTQRRQAIEGGLVPEDWDGECPLRPCQLCRSLNRPSFVRCRNCTSHLPRDTVSPAGIDGHVSRAELRVEREAEAGQ